MSSVEMFFEEESVAEENRSVISIRKNLRDNSNPIEFDNRTFIQNFRLSKEAFQYLLLELDAKLATRSRQRAVLNIIKLAAVLRFCAQGSYQYSVGNDFNLGLAQPTVSVILKEVLDVMESVICPKWIKFQYTEEETRKAKIYFYEKSSIPNVIGCMDGTHIKIIAPKEPIRHHYYNRKGFYSINAMILCDHLMNIRFISSKYPGASHDSAVRNRVSLKQKLEEDTRNGSKNCILGDAGYPLAPYLITPYRNTEEGSLQAIFNTKHAKGRNIIERTIGILKSRFRCILRARELHYAPEKATQIINVCAALHNTCLKYGVEEPEIEGAEEFDVTGNDNFIQNESTNNIFNEGRRIRDRIAGII